MKIVVVNAVPYGDEGALRAVLGRHPWLYCWNCGWALWHGATEQGAGIYFCSSCALVVDIRRIP